MKRKLLIYIFFLAWLVYASSEVNAATITVTSNANSGAGTLRQALSDVADGDSIQFNLSSGNETITISSYLSLPSNKSVTVNGDNTAGSGTNITVQVTTPGSSTFPVFRSTSTGSGKTATLSNITMRGGNAAASSGGTIYFWSAGNLVLDNATVKDGRGRFGAGMWANGFDSLTITNSTFRDNSSTEHGAGARIDTFSGTVAISGSTFTNNISTLTGGNYYGGAIYFQNNSVQGTVTIDKTTFSGNSVHSSGGGVYASNIADLTITNSTFGSNSANGGNGGGLYSYGGNVTLTNSTFSGNSCAYWGGGAYVGGTGKTHTLTNVTIANNVANSQDGDGFFLDGGTLYVKNSILANNSSGSSKDFYRSSGTVSDGGYNIVETSQGQAFSATGDITGNQANLNLSALLADNSTLFGTQTLDLSTGSVAIDAGNSTANNGVSVPLTDQRGLYRSGTTDIGAYEYGASTSTPTPSPSPTNTPTPTPSDSGAPVISDVSSSATSTSATITWLSDELSSSQIEYGLTSSYGTSTSESDTSPRVLNHSVMLSNLKSCRRYFFRAKSTDSASNVGISSQNIFSTTGCSVSSISTGSQQALNVVSGGEFQLLNNSSIAKLLVPDGFAGNDATFQINVLTTSGLTSPSGKTLADGNVFDLSAVDSFGAELSSFSKALTFTVTYGSSTENSFLEPTLDVYKYNVSTGGWDKNNCALDVASNTLTCSLLTFSIYGVFGQTATASSTSSSTTSNSGSNKGCSDSQPEYAPDLFQIDSTSTSATLFFTPILHNPQYYISYSTNPIAEEHGTLVNLGSEGVQHFTVDLLSPYSTYYFKVRGQRGCMPGQWSNIKQAMTGTLVPVPTPILKTNKPPKNANIKQCLYKVEYGDSLWSISNDVYGNGKHYKKLVEQNKKDYPQIEKVIHVGKELKIPCSKK